jgi:hypothetical protein
MSGQFGRAMPCAFILGLIYGVLDYDVFVCEEGRSSARRFAMGRFPELSDKQARSVRSAVLRECQEGTAAIRYYRRVITLSRHHQAHVGHCITEYPGLLTMALIRVDAGRR